MSNSTLAPPHLHRATALSVKAGSAAGRLVFPVLTTLALDGGTAPFVDSILDPVGSALGEAAGLTGPPLSRGQRTLEELKRYTLAHLATPDLSPASVAQACFVSSRQLHRLFEREGTTFGTFVKEARLARVQRDLTDPAMASLTIAEIGHRHAYRQPAVLTRAFTQRYGTGPREFRRSRHPSPTVRRAAASVSAAGRDLAANRRRTATSRVVPNLHLTLDGQMHLAPRRNVLAAIAFVLRCGRRPANQFGDWKRSLALAPARSWEFQVTKRKPCHGLVLAATAARLLMLADAAGTRLRRRSCGRMARWTRSINSASVANGACYANPIQKT